MKNKKPPVALISVLVISFLGLAIGGPKFAFYNKSQEDQQKQIHQEEEDRERAKVNEEKKELKVDSSAELEKMKKTLAADKGPKAMQQAQKSQGDGRTAKTTVPTVIMPDDVVRKPTLNPTSPVGQWYDK